MLTESPILAYPQLDVEFVLDTDASSSCSLTAGQWTREGGCLFQARLESTRMPLLCDPQGTTGHGEGNQALSRLPVW